MLESVDQVLVAWTEVALQGNWTDEMEEVVGGVEYESELGRPVVDSKWSFVPVTEPIVPESELETELVTVGSSYHLHKIVQKVRLAEVTETMGLTSRSSTCSPKSLASDQDTWPGKSGLVIIQTNSSEKMHPQRMHYS